MTSSKLLSFAAFTLGIVAVCGCGSSSGPERVPLSGTVTYQGQPVEKGEIRFLPIEGTTASPSGATINAGKYEVTARGGVPVGKFKVAITAFKTNPKPSAAKQKGIMGGADLIQYLPPKYNDESLLSITVDAKENNKTENFELK